MTTLPTRRPADVPVHEWQHRLIEARVAAFEQHPKRTGVDKHLRREAGKKAAWTVQGHLSGEHGFRHPIGPPLFLEDLLARHDAYHEEEDLCPATR